MPYGKCVLCGRVGNMHKHHIFEGDRRQRSERYGMTCLLCPPCHVHTDVAVHRCRETDLKLKRAAQRKFEREHTREGFIKLFGRSYL
jgi:hypothetical protein